MGSADGRVLAGIGQLDVGPRKPVWVIRLSIGGDGGIVGSGANK